MDVISSRVLLGSNDRYNIPAIDMGNSSDDEGFDISNSYDNSAVNRRNSQQQQQRKAPVAKATSTSTPSRGPCSISFLLNREDDDADNEEEEEAGFQSPYSSPHSPQQYFNSERSAFVPISRPVAMQPRHPAMTIASILDAAASTSSSPTSMMPISPGQQQQFQPYSQQQQQEQQNHQQQQQQQRRSAPVSVLANISTLHKTISQITHAPIRTTAAINIQAPRLDRLMNMHGSSPEPTMSSSSAPSPNSSSVSVSPCGSTPSSPSLMHEEEEEDFGLDSAPAMTNKRKRAAPDQLSILEETFAKDPLPNSATKQRLAQELGMSPRRVTIWFQNKRARLKKSGGREKSTSNTPSKKELLTFHHLGMQGGNLMLHSDGCEPVVLPPTLQRVPKRRKLSKRALAAQQQQQQQLYQQHYYQH